MFPIGNLRQKIPETSPGFFIAVNLPLAASFFCLIIKNKVIYVAGDLKPGGFRGFRDLDFFLQARIVFHKIPSFSLYVLICFSVLPKQTRKKQCKNVSPRHGIKNGRPGRSARGHASQGARTRLRREKTVAETAVIFQTANNLCWMKTGNAAKAEQGAFRHNFFKKRPQRGKTERPSLFPWNKRRFFGRLFFIV